MAKQSSLENEMALALGAVAVSNPTIAADSALATALNYCAEKMSLLGPQSVLDYLRLGDQNAHGYFQYALAHEVARYIAGFDDEVQAVYLYEYEATPEDTIFAKPQAAATVHLIVHARRTTEALGALMAALDRALAHGFAERAGLPEVQHLLDAQTVDDGEMERGKGYAALLNSVYRRPIKIWQR